MISIIIVGYNSKRYLEDCLSGIFASTYKNFEVTLVDNNSTDETVKFAKKHYPTVKIIKNNDNLGFTGGNNMGITEALENKSDYFFLLNPDTIIEKNCLKILVERANQKTILQPLILLHQENVKTEMVNTSGGVINFLGFSYCDGYKDHQKKYSRDKKITVGSGAALFIPSAVFKRIGLLDESFFMYHEDVDFCWRARLAGFNIQLIPKAKVWHKYSFSVNKKKFFYTERNRLMFLVKNFSFKYLCLIFPMMVINEILIIIYSIFGLWFFQKISSYLSFFRYLPRIIAERSKSSRISEKKLKTYISHQLSFSEFSSFLFYPYNIILSLYWRLIYFFV
jgi:hypothetical protein